MELLKKFWQAVIHMPSQIKRDMEIRKQRKEVQKTSVGVYEKTYRQEFWARCTTHKMWAGYLIGAAAGLAALVPAWNFVWRLFKGTLTFGLCLRDVIICLGLLGIARMNAVTFAGYREEAHTAAVAAETNAQAAIAAYVPAAPTPTPAPAPTTPPAPAAPPAPATPAPQPAPAPTPTPRRRPNISGWTP